jgi:DNA-binding GntR family transcriptional regulator
MDLAMNVFSHDLPSVTGLPSNPQHVDVVYARLRDAILRGDMKPGEEVRQERVAADLEVSRTPLREALRMLEREGLVAAHNNRSYRIAGYSLADIEQLYVVRLPLEAIAIRVTIPRLATQDLAVLEGQMAQMATFADAQDYELWEVPHREFHRGLVAKAGARVARLLTDLSDHAERYRRFYTVEGPRAWSTGVDEHRAILDACAAGDADEGASRLAAHLAHTARAVIRMTEPDYEPHHLRLALAMAQAPLPGAPA